jgi:hypothetical protein
MPHRIVEYYIHVLFVDVGVILGEKQVHDGAVTVRRCHHERSISRPAQAQTRDVITMTRLNEASLHQENKHVTHGITSSSN